MLLSKGKWKNTWKTVPEKQHLFSLLLENIETLQKSHTYVRAMLQTSCMKYVNPMNIGLTHVPLLFLCYWKHKTECHSVAPGEDIPSIFC